MAEVFMGILKNVLVTVISTVVCQLIWILLRKIYLNKAWVIYENTLLRKYMVFKIVIDMLISMMSYFCFGFAGIFISIALKKKYICIVFMILNIVSVIIYEILMETFGNLESYIYKEIKYLRWMISLMYHMPTVMMTGMFWSKYYGNVTTYNACIILWLIGILSYGFYEPVNKKVNKYVDIFTDTRKSYLNVECENISQKGQWYFIKEGNATRKIMKERVSEFVCHD
jgi:hypothetical protein